LFAKAKPNERHWYAYDVMFGGATIVSNSRDPEHDLARALLARGIKVDLWLTLRRPLSGASAAISKGISGSPLR
jgi:hypothetical protein